MGKINIPVRFKNPWFWVGLGGVILTAMGTDINQITSWPMLWQLICDTFGSPQMLASVAVAVLGVVMDPTTKGIGDSGQALQYKRPRPQTNKIPYHITNEQLHEFSTSTLRALAEDLGLQPFANATQEDLIELIASVEVYVPEGA